MNRSRLLISMMLVIQLPAITAQDFSLKEKSIIYTNAIKVLEDYQNIVNQIGGYVVTDIEKARSSSESFLELFVNRQVLIYNDLDPSHRLSEFYEAETYSSNVILWYPDGLSIKINPMEARVSEIMAHEDNVYSIDLKVTKSSDGNYLNQTINKNSEDLTFRIAFSYENRTMDNFRIAGIRSSSSNYQIDFSQVLKEVDITDLPDEDLNKIYGEIKSIMHDYVNYLSLIGDPRETSEDKEFYKASFIQLFQAGDTRLYNDITPEPQTSIISASDYLTNYITDYPDGINNISINTDSAKFGNVIRAEDGSFYTYTTVDKFFSGSFRGREPFRKMTPIIFKLSFQVTGKTFTDFKISGIDVSSLNFYSATPDSQAPPTPSIQIKPVTRKGFALALSAAFGKTRIIDNDIESMTSDVEMHSWGTAPSFGYSGALGISCFFSDNFALKSGVELNKYESSFSLNGNFTDDDLSVDINDDNYNRIISADYDSVVTINCITIPILLNYSSGKPGKTGFYIDAGAKLSIPVSAAYSVSGYYQYYGYYPDNPDIIKYVYFTELGFYNRQNIDETGEISSVKANLTFYCSPGINIPLGYYNSISIGPEITFGLSDILGNKESYIDIFRKSYDHKPATIRSVGLRLSFNYKL